MADLRTSLSRVQSWQDCIYRAFVFVFIEKVSNPLFERYFGKDDCEDYLRTWVNSGAMQVEVEVTPDGLRTAYTEVSLICFTCKVGTSRRFESIAFEDNE